MRITNLNPADEIGASSWLVDIEDHSLLLDAGLHPKLEGRHAVPLYDLAAGREVDAVVITHCHHDHVGSLPLALRHFPGAHVLMTELSYFLVERVLHNSVNVMQRQRVEAGIRDYPLFTHDEVDEISSLFQGFRYNREVEWAAFHKARAGASSPMLEFLDAGHVLGSAGVRVAGKRETLFFTGDVCFQDQTLLKGARFEEARADVLLMETTRGAREIPEGFTRAAELSRLMAAVSAKLEGGGSVLIPAFALGRTQEILCELALQMRAGTLRRQPVYIGGLGRVFTEIHDLESRRANRQHSALRLTEALDLQVLDQAKSASIKLNGKLFVITAGMMTEQTAAYSLALRMMPGEQHGIFFVGYADPGTPGGRLKQARRGEPFQFGETGAKVTRQCEVRDFDLSAHANREELMALVEQVGPRAIVLGHGDPTARAWFAEQLAIRHPKIRVHDPKPGETVET